MTPMPTTVPVSVTVTVAELLVTAPATAVTVNTPGAIDEKAPPPTVAMSVGEIPHATDEVTSAVWPSWKDPSALSCVVAPGNATGYARDSAVVAGVIEIPVRPGIDCVPASSPNPNPMPPLSLVS